MRSKLLLRIIIYCGLVNPVLPCRMLAVIAQPEATLSARSPSGGLNPALQSEIDEFRRQGGSGIWPYSNRDGWAMTTFSRSSDWRQSLTIRSAQPAFEDSAFYDQVDTLMTNDTTTVLLGHLRQVSSGAMGIQNPHPFLYTDPHGVSYGFAHNGDLNEDQLRQLIGDAWLNQHPPHTYGTGVWDGSGWPAVVDSELFLLWIMQNIENSGSIVTGLVQALASLEHELPGQVKNFIFSDGVDLYTYRSSPTTDIYYFDGNSTNDPPWYLELSGHRAVMSTPPTVGLAADFPWRPLADQHLLIFRGDGSSQQVAIADDLLAGDHVTQAEQYQLVQVFPNPFNSQINIIYAGLTDKFLELRIFDITGSPVFSAESNGSFSEATRFRWNGEQNNGQFCKSGPYLFTITAGNQIVTGKLLLLR